MYGSHPAVVDLSLLSPPVKLQSCGFSSGKTTTFIDNKSATTHCTHPDHMRMCFGQPRLNISNEALWSFPFPSDSSFSSPLPRQILLAASVRMTPPPLQTKPTCTTRAALSFRYQFGFSVHFCQKQILHIIHLSSSSPTNRRNKT